MKKLIFQEFLSLDGYAADNKNSTEFFEEKRFSEQSDQDLFDEMVNFDIILMGANTYKMFVEYWPGATNDEAIMADRLNNIPKIVFSNTLKKAPWGKWPEATIINIDAIEVVKKMRSGIGKSMVLWGSISLAQALMRESLIDEYHFRIVPKLLGSGRLLFENIQPLELELFESKQYLSGMMLLKYRRL